MSVVVQPRSAHSASAGRWRYHLAWLLMAAVVLTIAFICRVPEASVMLPGVAAPLPEVCLSRRLFGLDCPGCGLTRSFVSLAHGELGRAWQFNPAGLLWFAALAWQVPYRAVQLHLLRGGRELSVRRGFSEGVVLALMLACLAQWVLKEAARWF